MSKEHWPEKATAILPVTTAAIQNYNLHISSEEVAQVANTVLNTETKWTNNKIVGPAKLVSILGDGDLVRRITECLYAPLDETSKVKELSEFSKRIGIETIVRTNINIHSSVSHISTSGRWSQKFGQCVKL